MARTDQARFGCALSSAANPMWCSCIEYIRMLTSAMIGYVHDKVILHHIEIAIGLHPCEQYMVKCISMSIPLPLE